MSSMKSNFLLVAVLFGAYISPFYVVISFISNKIWVAIGALASKSSSFSLSAASWISQNVFFLYSVIKSILFPAFSFWVISYPYFDSSREPSKQTSDSVRIRKRWLSSSLRIKASCSRNRDWWLCWLCFSCRNCCSIFSIWHVFSTQWLHSMHPLNSPGEVLRA